MTFLNDTKPSLDNVIEHHGVKGQKWGVRRDPEARAASTQARQQLKTVRVSNRAAVRAETKKHTINNPTNTQIKTARENQDKHHDAVSKARAKYKTDKAQYRIDKERIGKTQAKIVLEKHGKLSLQKAKARRDANLDVAQRETSDEHVTRVIKQILGV